MRPKCVLGYNRGALASPVVASLLVFLRLIAPLDTARGDPTITGPRRAAEWAVLLILLCDIALYQH